MEKRKVVTGINEIDRDLRNGELEKGKSHLFLHGTNDAKSMTMISLNCHNAKIGNRTLHIGLEGKRFRTEAQMISNLASIPYKKLLGIESPKAIKNADPSFFNESEISAINSVKEISNRIRVNHPVAYSTEESIELIIRDEYRKEPMELVTIDFFQLITTDRIFSNEIVVADYILRKLNLLADELGIVIVIAYQVTRTMYDELRRQFERGNINASFELLGLSRRLDLNQTGTIISFVRSSKERQEGVVRFILEKQTEGVIGTQVAIVSNFEKMNIFEGPRVELRPY